MARPFLTAAWRDLLLLNWKAERSLLEPHVPEGTELDSWKGDCYVSLVGFRFLDLAVKGLPAVGHRDFHVNRMPPNLRTLKTCAPLSL